MAKESKLSGKKYRREESPPEALSLQGLIDRLPPSNFEAEKNVVGAILLDSDLCDDVSLLVRPDDFHSNALRRIFRRLLEMKNTGIGIDLMLLVENLRNSGELEEIGGEAFLGEIMQSVQVVAHVHHYAGIVREQAIRRDLIHAGSTILRDAYLPEIAPRDLLSQAEQRILGVGDSRSAGNVPDMKTVMAEAMTVIDLRLSGHDDGVKTGFRNLDYLLGGLHKSELIILAARPSMGKTALATNIADYVALEKKETVLFVSLEMSKIELAIRMLCARGRIKGEHFKRNSLSTADRQLFVKTASELSNSPLFIDDTPSRTITEIAAAARRIQRQEGLGLIVIDYLGLIEPDNPSDPRQEQVAKIARRLKGLARELRVPVLCLAQLNRMTEETKDKRPRLSHLRESGAIEQDADVVMFVHRDEYYKTSEQSADDRNKGEALIIVAKQRNGPVGDVKVAWQSEYTLFSNLANEMGEYTDDFDQYARPDESSSGSNESSF